MFRMFYGERIDPDTHQIAERGIFHSLAEFLPYRAAGWSSTAEINACADEEIAKAEVPERMTAEEFAAMQEV